MAKLLCHLLMKVNHVIVAIFFYVANMSFNAIRENRILAKISEFTVIQEILDTNGLQIVYCCMSCPQTLYGIGKQRGRKLINIGMLYNVAIRQETTQISINISSV